MQIVKTSDFLKYDAQGHLDVQQRHDVLARLAKACVDHDIHCALLDVRDARSALGLKDLYTLARSFQEMGFREHHRLAVLHRYNAAERAQMFAMFATTRGWNVRAVEDYEEAIEWFSATEPVDNLVRGES